MANLAGPLMGVNDTGKAQNQKVAKSSFLKILILILLVKYFIPP